ncbi:ABC transporter substrate-binding protein [Pseudomonas sp. UBA6310]|uniref:ABC transporter substrate-binding protein n=1 Tax=Pseudomonas sp. UBA6310 TaxID=1947327 RepID=UPI00257B795D|nr:extracellular solute-binding protein [Pseudomonas sp. UBA6310]
MTDASDRLTHDLFNGARSRRDMLKLLGIAGAAGLLGGPLLSGRAEAAAKHFTWGTNADYARPEFLAPFLKASGIEVQTSLFADPSEIITKLQSGGAGVELLTDGSYHAQITYDAGVLKPIDTARLKNWSKLIPGFDKAAGMIYDGKTYGVPYAWGTDSMVYNHGIVGQDVDDLAILFDKEFAGRIAMPNGLFESVVVAALYLGIKTPFAMDKDQLDAVAEVLIKQKPLVRSYWNDIGDLKNLMATGEVAVCWGWQPLLEIRKYDVDVRWTHPKQGELAWYDAAFLTRDANAESEAACLAFIDYLLGEQYGAMIGKDIGYRTTSTAAIATMDSKLVDSLDLAKPDAFLKNAVWWTSPTNPAGYQAVWDKVLNA